MLKCHVVMSYLEPGVNGLLGGLALLARDRRIELTIEQRPVPPPVDDGPWHLRDKAESGIEIHVDGGPSAYVDVHDSWEIDAGAYAAHRFYFKRSYDPVRFPRSAYPGVHPLGLVYDVRLDGFDAREAQRILGQRTSVRARMGALARFCAHSALAGFGLGPRPNLSSLLAPPDPEAAPRVLFMAGVWDPALVPRESPEKAAEYESINEMRAACVRALRLEFGARFYGGIQHSTFASRCYGDVLLPEARSASKRAYLRRVRGYPVCVATMGLHGSNGWKLAEYAGLSRAIVSERLRYAIPGEFVAGRQYLEFHSGASCVEAVGRLFEDRALRGALMEESWRYYCRWMRPDALARHVIGTMTGAAP